MKRTALTLAGMMPADKRVSGSKAPRFSGQAAAAGGNFPEGRSNCEQSIPPPDDGGPRGPGRVCPLCLGPASATDATGANQYLSLIHISEPTRQAEISYAVFCLKKKKK